MHRNGEMIGSHIKGKRLRQVQFLEAPSMQTKKKKVKTKEVSSFNILHFLTSSKTTTLGFSWMRRASRICVLTLLCLPMVLLCSTSHHHCHSVEPSCKISPQSLLVVTDTVLVEVSVYVDGSDDYLLSAVIIIILWALHHAWLLCPLDLCGGTSEHTAISKTRLTCTEIHWSGG